MCFLVNGSVNLFESHYKIIGDIHDVSNYRGSTLLGSMRKMLISILNGRIKQYSCAMHVIKGNETGFRGGYSALDHILVKCKIDLSD